VLGGVATVVMPETNVVPGSQYSGIHIVPVDGAFLEVAWRYAVSLASGSPQYMVVISSCSNIAHFSAGRT